MNQEIKQQWVEALRSGEFEQGVAALSRKGKFCCLGVLTELGHRAGVISKGERDHFGDMHYGAANEDLHLPAEIMAWAEIGTHNPTVNRNCALSVLNDSGSSFSEIATLIEEQL